MKLVFCVITIKFINDFGYRKKCRNNVSAQLNKMVTKMNTKKLLVSFSLAVVAIFLVATVSALSSPDMHETTISATGSTEITDTAIIEVDGINVVDNPAVIAGESVTVMIQFKANVSAQDVNVKVELEGDKVDSEAVSTSFDIEAGKSYKKTLKLQVPSELKDDLSDNVVLNIKVWNGDYKSEFENIEVRVQRPSYNPVVKSITVSQSVSAGESFPVDIVLKNLGYNELDDVYTTVAIAELGVYKTVFFGDIVSLESEDCDSDDDDCDDTVSGRLFLEVPYGVDAGVYTLEVTVENDDVVSKATKQIVVENDFAENVIVTASSKTASVGEEAEYTLLLVNPTNSLKVYTLVSESNAQVSSTTESVVAVPAGSSKEVTVKAKALEEGKYDFNVNVLSGSKTEATVKLSLNAEEKNIANPVVVLTVILAIVFLVLLVVLIVLLGKKPKKTEEFGESYY